MPRPLVPLAATLLLPLLLAADPSTARMADEQSFALVERGRYLAQVGDCTACHTDTEGGRPFAGGRPIETPFGNVTAPNIAPDVDTGIGGWTDDQFDAAVRKGILPDGARLYPAMPYTAYTKMSRQDVLAIRAYLNTLEPVAHRVVSDTLPFPFNIRTAMRVWDWLYFKDGEYKPDPNQSAQWNRGAYIVQGPGHCGACHTPKTFLGGDKSNDFLRGAQLQGWFAPDITNNAATGLGAWSADEIVAYLKTGHNDRSAATGPMGEAVADSTSKMTDDDLAAIATYLKSLGGSAQAPAAVAGNDPAMTAGQAIYRDQCSACHGLDGKGVPDLFPSLADSSVVRAQDPTTLIRLVLQGARSVATPGQPTGPGMPSYSWQLDDAQVAAVLTYIRNAWKPAAPAVSQSDVSHARSQLQARTE